MHSQRIPTVLYNATIKTCFDFNIKILIRPDLPCLNFTYVFQSLPNPGLGSCF